MPELNRYIAGAREVLFLIGSAELVRLTDRICLRFGLFFEFFSVFMISEGS